MGKYGKRENYDLAISLIKQGNWTVDPQQGLILGRGRSTGNVWKSIGSERDGYLRVRLGYNGPSLSSHRVIWEYVHGPSDLDLTINHKDGDSLNNKIDNLELVTNAENQIHSMRILGRGLGSRNEGTTNPMSKLNEDTVKEIRHRLGNGEPLYSLAERFNVNITTVSAIKRRDTWDWVKGEIDKCSSCPDHWPIRPPRPIGAKGEHASKSKLTEEEVLVIRQRYDEGETPKLIAKDYPVSPSTISNIGARRIWRHVDECIRNFN